MNSEQWAADTKYQMCGKFNDGPNKVIARNTR